MTNTWHPDELKLIDAASDPERDSEVVAHISGCAVCASDVEFLQQSGSRPLTPMRTARLSRDAPAAGDIWRVRWDDIATLVTIAGVNDDSVDAAPILAGSDELDGWRPLPVLGTAMGLWPLRVELPVRVLDYRVDRLESDELDGVAWIPGDEVVIADAFGRHAIDASDALDQMLTLAEAAWIPVGEGRPVGELLAEHFGKPSELASAAGIRPGDARRVLQGKRPLTGSELDALASHHPDFAGSTHSVDAALAWAIDQPEVRPMWESAAAAAGTTDSPEFRWQMYSAGDFTLAARTTGAATSRERALATVKAVLSGRS